MFPLHLEPVVGRRQRVQAAADLETLELLAHVFHILCHHEPLTVEIRHGEIARDLRLQAGDLLAVAVHHGRVLGVPLRIRRCLQLLGRIIRRGEIGLAVSLRLQPRDLRPQAVHGCLVGHHVGGRQRRIQGGEDLAGFDDLAFVDVDLPHDRGVERLDDECRALGDEPALGGHGDVDRDHGNGNHRGDDQACDQRRDDPRR